MRYLMLLCLVACSGPAKPIPASTGAFDVTTYYVGTSQVSSPDGETPYGPETETVVQRVVSPSRHQIVETVLIDGKMTDTTLTQTDVEDVFTATAEGDLFTGTLTYAGPAWAWTGWDYDLTLAGDGGTITGHAEITDTEIHTEKLFTDADGQAQAKIVEDIHAVPEAEFVARRDALTAPPPVPQGDHAYYAGTTSQWTADRSMKLVTHPMLIERIVNAADHTVTEITTVEGVSGTRTLNPTDVELVLAIESEAGTGTMTCVDATWTSCDFELHPSAAVKQTGHLEISADGYRSTAQVFASEHPAAILEQDLQAVPEADYRAQLAKLTGS